MLKSSFNCFAPGTNITTIWDESPIGTTNFSLRPGHMGQMEGLRMDREQIPTFARFGGVVRDVQSAHESRTDRIRTALIVLETR